MHDLQATHLQRAQHTRRSRFQDTPGQGHGRHLAGGYDIGKVEVQQGPAAHAHRRPPRARYSIAQYQASH